MSKNNKSKLDHERRNYNRFDVSKRSISVKLILDDYKHLPGVSPINNISLGGMNILVKNMIATGTDLKFQFDKNKTIFHGKVAWCKNSNVESFPHSIGISFTFPFKDEANKQKKELLSYVVKTLNRMPKDQLVDRLMNLFIERRRIFDTAQEHISQATKELEIRETQANESQERAHLLIDKALIPILFLNKNGDIVYSNEKAEKTLDYKSNDLKELSIRNLVNESTDKMIKRYMKTPNEGEFNGAVIHKNGAELPIKWKLISFEGDTSKIHSLMFILK